MSQKSKLNQKDFYRRRSEKRKVKKRKAVIKEIKRISENILRKLIKLGGLVLVNKISQ